jgi:hypothetical protein
MSGLIVLIRYSNFDDFLHHHQYQQIFFTDDSFDGLASIQVKISHKKII